MCSEDAKILVSKRGRLNNEEVRVYHEKRVSRKAHNWCWRDHL